MKGVFDEYCQTFKDADIPNEYALASYIDQKIKKFHVDRYRYVHQDKIDGYISIDAHIEQRVLESGTTVKLNTIEKWVTKEIGARKSIVHSAISRINEIISVNPGYYLHIDNLGIDQKELSFLSNYIKEQLKIHSQIGIHKVYNNNIVFMEKLRIHSKRMLYSIIEYYFSDIFELSKYPHISIAKRETYPLTLLIEQYFLKKNKIVLLDELINKFKKQGYLERYISARIKNSTNLLDYYTGSVVHKNTIGWSEKKSCLMEDILMKEYELRIDKGYLVGNFEEIIDFHEEKLPKLKNELSWTLPLILSITRQIPKIKTIGNAKRAYIVEKKPFNGLGDLIAHVVKNVFRGGCSVKEMNEWLIKNDIVSKKLTNQMFTPPRGLKFTKYEFIWLGVNVE